MHDPKQLNAFVFGAKACLKEVRKAAYPHLQSKPPSSVEEDLWAKLRAFSHLRQHWAKQQQAQNPVLSTSRVTQTYLHSLLSDQPRECFVALYLDAGLRLIESNIVAMGTLSEARVYPRELAREALEYGAKNLVVAHNHPSGRLEPSAQDVALTERLETLLGLLEIDLVDHCIVTPSQVYSIKFGVATDNLLELSG